MGDILRYVTLEAGGRPVVLTDLNDFDSFTTSKESFTVTPGTKQPMLSDTGRRYGGSRQVGETTENGSVSWTMLVSGSTADECIAAVERMLSQLESSPVSPSQLLLEWRPDGSSHSEYYEVRGTGTWTPRYEWAQFAGAQSMTFDVSIPVAPLARGLPMDIIDSYEVDSQSDYTYDSGLSSDESIVSDALTAATNPTVEHRAIHTARGYSYTDAHQIVAFSPVATITGFKAGVVLKRTAANNYIECYIDDEGTHSRVRIDKVLAGVRTNLATANLASRITEKTLFFIAGRIEGDVITAEYFNSANGGESPMAAAISSVTHTLTSGTEKITYGIGVSGQCGRVWIPMLAGAKMFKYSCYAYTYKSVETPKTLALLDVPGNAPSLADVVITPSGGAAAPVWALLGWSNGSSQLGVVPATSASNLVGWSNVSSAEGISGHILEDATSEAAQEYRAFFTVEPHLLAADVFTTEAAVEVWARVTMDSTIVTPSITASIQSTDGAGYGSPRYTDEWGSMGKLITPPSGGTKKWRLVRLGTLRMPVDSQHVSQWSLTLQGFVGAGSSGRWGLDYLVLVPATQRASSPSSKPLAEGFPSFVSTTGETTKVIKHDLSGGAALPPHPLHPDHGLGGQLIEFTPGSVNVTVKLSSLAADDPTANESTEQLLHKATCHFAITPRWYLARSS